MLRWDWCYIWVNQTNVYGIFGNKKFKELKTRMHRYSLKCVWGCPWWASEGWPGFYLSDCWFSHLGQLDGPWDLGYPWIVGLAELCFSPKFFRRCRRRGNSKFCQKRICSHQLMTSTRPNHTQRCQRVGVVGQQFHCFRFRFFPSNHDLSHAFKARTKQARWSVSWTKIAIFFLWGWFYLLIHSVYLTASPLGCWIVNKIKTDQCDIVPVDQA